MIDQGVANWTRAVETAMRGIASPETMDELAGAWRRHAEQPLVQVAIWGAYNSGKSTLLKRLLVEDGTPVPPWLTIGAAPETYEVRAVPSGGLAYVDTPGLSTGDARHEALSVQALELTDALVVTLLPTLLGEAQELVNSVVDGSFYRLPAGVPPFPAGGLVLVVTRLDQSAAATDEPARFEEHRALKRRELTTMLEELGVSPAPVTHLVVADLEGLVGAELRPTLEDYVRRGDWDGIAALREDLRAMASRRDELRTSAAIRYWGRAASGLLVQVDDELARLRAGLEEAEQEHERIQGLETELEGIAEAASADLRARILKQLEATALSPGVTEAAALEEAARLLEPEVASWFALWGAKLNGFARGADFDAQVQAEGPAAIDLRSYLGDLLTVGGQAPVPVRSGEARPAFVRLLDRVSGLRDVLDAEPDVSAPGPHVTASQATSAVPEQQVFLEFEQLWVSQSEEGTVQGFYRKEELSVTSVPVEPVRPPETSWTDSLRSDLIKAVPVLVELGKLVMTERDIGAGERRDYEQRQALRASLGPIATELRDRILRGDGETAATSWNAAIDRLREMLRGAHPPRSLLTSIIRAREQTRESIAGLLTSPAVQARRQTR